MAPPSGDKALVVVDIQTDFCPGGALPVKDGDKIIPAVNELVRAFEGAGLPVFFTRDWHPKNHVSFKAYGGPWPPHCVRNTPGAGFHRSLAVPKEAEVIDKGTLQAEDAYSGFQGTDLEERLRGHNLSQILRRGVGDRLLRQEHRRRRDDQGLRDLRDNRLREGRQPQTAGLCHRPEGHALARGHADDERPPPKESEQARGRPSSPRRGHERPGTSLTGGGRSPASPSRQLEAPAHPRPTRSRVASRWAAPRSQGSSGC